MPYDYLGCPRCGEKVKSYRNPFPTVDIIIEINGGIVLIERRNEPLGWALPGGFVDYGESLEDAAAREAREETSLAVSNLRLLGCYSDPGRDPRQHTISTVFIAEASGEAMAGDDADESGTFHKDSLPVKIVFDHKQILEDYLTGGIN